MNRRSCLVLSLVFDAMMLSACALGDDSESDADTAGYSIVSQHLEEGRTEVVMTVRKAADARSAVADYRDAFTEEGSYVVGVFCREGGDKEDPGRKLLVGEYTIDESGATSIAYTETDVDDCG